MQNYHVILICERTKKKLLWNIIKLNEECKLHKKQKKDEIEA